MPSVEFPDLDIKETCGRIQPRQAAHIGQSVTRKRHKWNVYVVSYNLPCVLRIRDSNF